MVPPDPSAPATAPLVLVVDDEAAVRRFLRATDLATGDAVRYLFRPGPPLFGRSAGWLPPDASPR